MIDLIFRWCVILLVGLADLLGISYEAVNVWIFVILWPLITLGLIAVIVGQQVRVRRLSERHDEAQHSPKSNT